MSSLKDEPDVGSYHSRSPKLTKSPNIDGRSEAQRVKNREAVRNCRKRKKEQAKQLLERIEQLERDNAKLRNDLKVGKPKKNGNSPNEEDEFDRSTNLENTLREMEKHVALKGTTAESSLKRDLNLYLEKHQDHGRDRQKAIGFIVHGLQRLIQPARVTKMYMHLLSQVDDLDPNGLWRQACKELELTEEQESQLKRRRVQAQRIKTELDYAHAKMNSIWERLCRNKKLADSIAEINDILGPKQLASFTLWVYKNPACKDILNSLWDDLMKQSDLQIKEDMKNNSLYKDVMRRFQISSARMVSNLFTITDEEERKKQAKLCMHSSISILDPNNGADMIGIGGVMKYVKMIDRAFLANKKGNKMAPKIDVQELYIRHDDEEGKITGSWRLTGNYKGKLRNPLASPESPASSVTFNVVGDFSFGDKDSPELITEIVISFDALELMNQLGLTSSNLKALPTLTELPPPLAEEQEEEKKNDAESDTLLELQQDEDPMKRYEGFAVALAAVFAAEPKNMLVKANEVLAPKCEFHDVYSGLSYKGVEECLEYVNRLRRVFPTMNTKAKVTSHVLLPPSNKYKGMKLYRLECKWVVKAVYNGKLLSGRLEGGKNKDCEYEGITHTEHCPHTGRIIRADLILVAQDLMHQLGILK